jgi:hypothetical protein
VAQIFKNNTTGTLAAQLNAGATTCTLNAGHTFTDPGSDWYLATLVGVTGTTETSWEIVKVTNVATNTLTIERAQESTSDATWPAGTRIEARLTAGATESKANLGAAAYKAVGTGSGDVAAGNRGVTNGDSHAHGNITAAGAIGSTANLPVITTTSGALTVGAFGTGATNFCVGNDARLSNARTPTAHNQAETTITFTDVSTGNASTTAHGFAPKATAPASGLRSVLAIDNGETVRSDKALFDATNPAALGTASPGTAMTAARRDHVHALPALGKILQVVATTSTTQVTVASGTYTDIGLSVTITPRDVNSKILLLASFEVNVDHHYGGNSVGSNTKLLRGASVVQEKIYSPWVLNPPLTTTIAYAVLDSPSTASAITYKLQGKVSVYESGKSVDFIDSGSPGSLIALEVAG